VLSVPALGSFSVTAPVVIAESLLAEPVKIALRFFASLIFLISSADNVLRKALGDASVVWEGKGDSIT
jgi:hypothetical protein